MSDTLCYCGNVHSAHNLDELLQSIESGPALVRESLGSERIQYGLWLSESALAESIKENHSRLREALAEKRIDVCTMNAFPQGDFQAEVVKYEVYNPNWADLARLDYTLQCASLLTELVGPGQDATLSTLPLGLRTAFASAQDVSIACANLCQAALVLSDMATQSGKSIRICLEPEPGCYLETGKDFIRFWQGPLAEAAAAIGAEIAVQEHLGMCLDTCHHALLFEDATDLVTSLKEAKVPIGKVQLSSAISLDPTNSESLRALQELDEKRFLHQVRTQTSHEGEFEIHGCDDISESAQLPTTSAWRVHFHVPIHRSEFAGLRTTQDFMCEIISALRHQPDMPLFEVETYTWNVMPDSERPNDAKSLAACIADELRYAKEKLI